MTTEDTNIARIGAPQPVLYWAYLGASRRAGTGTKASCSNTLSRFAHEVDGVRLDNTYSKKHCATKHDLDKGITSRKQQNSDANQHCEYSINTYTKPSRYYIR